VLGLVVFGAQVLALKSLTDTAHQSNKEKDSLIEHLRRSDGSRWANVVLMGRWMAKSN
jgi:hypothetical protein